MTIRTEAGKDAVDHVSADVERIEDEVFEGIGDAIGALDRYDVTDGSLMVRQRDGDWLDRSEVFDAMRAWADR